MKSTTTNAGAKERLIEAAGVVFGEQGYHGATVREITRQAGVNLAAINYYFRDKEELYWSVLQHAVQCSLKSDQDPGDEVYPEERLATFISSFLHNMLDPRRPDWHGKLIAREMGAPTRMLDILVESSIRPKGQKLRQILHDLVGLPMSPEQEALFSASIMGQCLYYRQNRPVVERLYPDLLNGRDAVEKLARHITDFSLAAIKGLTSPALSTI